MGYVPFAQIVGNVAGGKMGSFERGKVQQLERDIAAKRMTVDDAVGQLSGIFDYKLLNSEIHKIRKEANYRAGK